MCGIGGVINKRQEDRDLSPVLEAMAHAIRRRGPNGVGFHTDTFGDRKVGFFNVRLAIVDIAGGGQPIYSDDRRYGIVYNGEVYNHEEIRPDLEARGFRFDSHCDTEVVLRLFEAEGPESFRRLNGMFGVCLWDATQGTVVLGRDHIGIKPLYIYEDPDRIVFCSELRGILAVGAQLGLDLEVDARGIQDYLTFRYIQAPFTCFKRIRRLDPGTYLRIAPDRVTQHRYWDPEYSDPYPTPKPEAVVEELDHLLRKAVQSQLMGEVPIGVLLSGGLDSSSIAYAVHKLGANLITYNIGFPEVNEFEYSRAVAEAYDLEHIEVVLTSDQLVSGFDEIMDSLDEPIGDRACFPLSKLCEDLRKRVTVVLSGEGGDELFCGYPQYERGHYAGLSDEAKFDRFLARSWYFDDARMLMAEPGLPPHTLRFRKYFAECPGEINPMLSYDMKTWMPENLMMKADKVLMWHSLEGRFPFLDKDLFEWSCRLPERYKLAPDGTSKWVLRTLMRDKLPEVISTRPKMGFSVPTEELLLRLKPKVDKVLVESFPAPLKDLLRWDLIRDRTIGYYERGEGTALQIWTWFILAEWFDRNLSR